MVKNEQVCVYWEYKRFEGKLVGGCMQRGWLARNNRKKRHDGREGIVTEEKFFGEHTGSEIYCS